MEPVSPSYSAIVGCGPSGCFLLSLLRQSQAKAMLIAVDDAEDSLEMANVDQKILVKPGDQPIVDVSAFEVVFVVFDPSEGNTLKIVQDLASRISAEGAYVYAVALNKPGSSLNEAELARLAGGASIVDAAYVMDKRGSDEERALQIAFNFAAHTLTFLAAALDSGDLKLSHFKEITAGGVAGFAVTHMTEAESLYAMMMSKINIDIVKSGFVFIDAGTTDVIARRIFLRVAASLPRESNLSMLRVNGLAPFKIMAMFVR